jgi:AraC-like DNA-binding protein
VLKDSTGRTTTDLIGGRLAQEAKVLLRQTDWTPWEIADSLCFVDVAHFSPLPPLRHRKPRRFQHAGSYDDLISTTSGLAGTTPLQVA